MAIMWYFENMSTHPGLDQPLLVKKAVNEDKGAGGGDDVPAELVANLAMMGFPEKQCKKALRECNNDVERAMDWIFSHPDDDGEED